MNTDKNSYIYIFSAVVVVVVAVVLSLAATLLGPSQKRNLDAQKMQDILRTIRVDVSRDEAVRLFRDYVKDMKAVGYTGQDVDGGDIFNMNLTAERKKPAEEQALPVYVAEKNDSTFYIIPLDGDGLWNAIWGYIALQDDFNTVYGVVFDHKGETAGLGGEIASPWFEEQFRGKQLFDPSGNVEFTVQKGGVATLPEDKRKWAVDGITGGTITGQGVTDMIRERLSHYVPYFEKMKNEKNTGK